jgi:hypothetical protein
MLYSLKDIQLALSAADFLQDCVPDQPINKVELRRYKCFESTAIVSYARPFSESEGGVPKLSMKMIGVRLDPEKEAMHNEIIQLRNRVVAHSDAEMMRMVVQTRSVNLGNGETMPYFNMAFDEGLDFLGDRVSKMLDLFHTVYSGIHETLMADLRVNPEKFSFRHDYLDERS